MTHDFCSCSFNSIMLVSVVGAATDEAPSLFYLVSNPKEKGMIRVPVYLLVEQLR